MAIYWSKLGRVERAGWILALLCFGASCRMGTPVRARASRQNTAMRFKRRSPRRRSKRPTAVHDRGVKVTTHKRSDYHFHNTGGTSGSFMTTHAHARTSYMSKMEMRKAMRNEQRIQEAIPTRPRLRALAFLLVLLLAILLCPLQAAPCSGTATTHYGNFTFFNPFANCRVGEASNPGPDDPHEAPGQI